MYNVRFNKIKEESPGSQMEYWSSTSGGDPWESNQET